MDPLLRALAAREDVDDAAPIFVGRGVEGPVVGSAVDHPQVDALAAQRAGLDEALAHRVRADDGAPRLTSRRAKEAGQLPGFLVVNSC